MSLETRDFIECCYFDAYGGSCSAHETKCSNVPTGDCPEFELNDPYTDDGYEEMTTYGHCTVENPYSFIPDLECNTDTELISWRRALIAADDGAYERPEHFFWKTVDEYPNPQDIGKLLDECGGIFTIYETHDGKITIHGHSAPWGMGINGSSRINVWDEYPSDK